ncbi:MAG TPA: hypothetical protein DDY80_01120, partial [Parabacteroides merdae]|nr:hypothetical protein [Parabacteroides merdae]
MYLSNEKPETYREDTESKIVIFWNIRVKFVRQYPVECIDISKHFYTFVVFPWEQHIIDESVLLLSLTGNLTVFKNTRITMALITCIAMYRSDIYYSGVGYCLFVFGFCQNLLSDK